MLLTGYKNIMKKRKNSLTRYAPFMLIVAVIVLAQFMHLHEVTATTQEVLLIIGCKSD